jgi:hypothetical protein
MQMSGSFSALNGGYTRNAADSRRGVPAVDRSVSRAQVLNPIAPQKKRRLLVQSQGRNQNPMGKLAQNPGLSAMVGRALNVRPNSI